MRRLGHAFQALLYLLLSAAMLTACGNDVSGPPEPAFVILVNAYYGEYVQDSTSVERNLVLQPRNEGGPGAYRFEVWSEVWSFAGPDYVADTVMELRTEPVEVTEDYADTLYYSLQNSPVYVLVLSRDQGSMEYRQTDSVGRPFSPHPLLP